MRQFYLTWAQGFMSGLNTGPLLSGRAANLGASSTNDQQAFIDQFCDQRPVATYVAAVMSLYDTMRTGQGLNDWRPAPKN